MQTCGGLTASVKDFKICSFVSCLVSSYAPILIICLFLSHLVHICVTLYFLCPCKMPSVLPGTRQGINMNKFSQHLAPWASGSTSRFAASQPFGSIQAQSNRLCSCAAIVPQALPLRTSLNSWLLLAWTVWSGFLAPCCLTSISCILLLRCPPLLHPNSGICFLSL